MNFNILELVYCHKLLWLILRLKCLVLVIRVFKVGVVVEKGGGEGGSGMLPIVVGYGTRGARKKHIK